jgi:hypothetical protein
MTSLTSTNVFTIACLSTELTRPASVNLVLQHSGKPCKVSIALFVDYSRTIRTIRRLFVLFVDYSHYSSTIRGQFVLFVHYSHYSLHYSIFVNCHWLWGNWQQQPLNLGVPVLCRHVRLTNVKPITSQHRKNSISPVWESQCHPSPRTGIALGTRLTIMWKKSGSLAVPRKVVSNWMRVF